MATFRFLSFGSGSSGNCYLLESSEGSLLLDAGVGFRRVKKYFAAYGVNSSRLQGIVLTHDHTDHVAAVALLAINLGIPVYATAAVHSRIATNYHIHRKLPASLVRTIDKGVPFSLAGFTLEAFPVPHDSADCSGYVIEREGRRFVVVTDCGNVTPEVKSHAEEADYLMLEANYDAHMLETGPYPRHLKERIAGALGHMSNSDAARLLGEGSFLKLREVMLCHLSENNNTHALAAEAVSKVLREKGVPFRILERRGVTGWIEME